MGQTPQERRRAEFFPPISLFLPFVLSKSAEGRNDASADSAYPNRKRTLHAQCPPASRRIGCSNIFGDRSFKVQRVVLPSKRKHAHQREPYLHKRVRPVFLRVAQQVRVRAAVHLTGIQTFVIALRMAAFRPPVRTIDNSRGWAACWARRPPARPAPAGRR